MKYRLIVTIAVAGILLGSVVLSFSTGPPDARTGAPGESNCTACHTSFPLNSGNGSLTITAPATYTSGQSIDVTVFIQDPGQSRWGFEVTVLDALNQPAGTLVVTDPARTQKTLALSGREYVKHTVNGTVQPGVNPESQWTFQWTASGPVSGPVTFFAAGNAANNNGFNTGDFIYTTSKAVSQAAVACCVGKIGHANGSGDDLPTIGDISVMIDAKFITGACIESGPSANIRCLGEADANLSGGANPTCDDISIGDISMLIDDLFITGEPPFVRNNCAQ